MPPIESLDPTALYFKEIRRTPPLPHKDFLKHWRKFRAGEKAKILLERARNKNTKRTLAQTVRDGENSKIALIIGNLRLVIPIAKKYYHSNIDFLDLVEEGNIGLLHALKKFIPSKGFKFSTYSSYWIEQAIRRFIEEHSKMIRIPPHAWESLRKWFREWEGLTLALGRAPTNNEMKKKLKVSERQLKGILEAVEASRGIGSLDSTMDEEENLSLKDIISDDKKNQPEHLLQSKNVQSDINDALNKLSKREKEIIYMRFGVDGGESLTLEEVGEKYNISRERVRQLQERALSKLKRIAMEMGLN